MPAHEVQFQVNLQRLLQSFCDWLNSLNVLRFLYKSLNFHRKTFPSKHSQVELKKIHQLSVAWEEFCNRKFFIINRKIFCDIDERWCGNFHYGKVHRPHSACTSEIAFNSSEWISMKISDASIIQNRQRNIFPPCTFSETRLQRWYRCFWFIINLNGKCKSEIGFSTNNLLCFRIAISWYVKLPTILLTFLTGNFDFLHFHFSLEGFLLVTFEHKLRIVQEHDSAWIFLSCWLLLHSLNYLKIHLGGKRIAWALKRKLRFIWMGNKNININNK